MVVVLLSLKSAANDSQSLTGWNVKSIAGRPQRHFARRLDESLDNLKMHCAVNQDRLSAMHGSGLSAPRLLMPFGEGMRLRTAEM
jgi:hypothetical protein